MWNDTTNGQTFVHNGNTFVPTSAPAVSAPPTFSVNGGGLAGLFYMPAVTGTLGGAWTVPAGYVGMVYDMVHNRLCIVGSGGATFKTVAFA